MHKFAVIFYEFADITEKRVVFERCQKILMTRLQLSIIQERRRTIALKFTITLMEGTTNLTFLSLPNAFIPFLPKTNTNTGFLIKQSPQLRDDN